MGRCASGSSGGCRRIRGSWVVRSTSRSPSAGVGRAGGLGGCPGRPRDRLGVPLRPVKRDDWASVMRAIENREMDALLTWESSRAMRDMTAYAELRDACVAAGVRWGYSGKLHDLSDRDGRFRTGLDALLAEDEAARTSERLRRTTRHAALAGQAAREEPLRLPAACTTRRPGLLQRIEPHPDQAPIVREAARRILAGETMYQIAKSFNRARHRAAPSQLQGAPQEPRVDGGGDQADADSACLRRAAAAPGRDRRRGDVACADRPRRLGQAPGHPVRPVAGRLRNDTPSTY